MLPAPLNASIFGGFSSSLTSKFRSNNDGSTTREKNFVIGGWFPFFFCALFSYNSAPNRPNLEDFVLIMSAFPTTAVQKDAGLIAQIPDVNRTTVALSDEVTMSPVGAFPLWSLSFHLSHMDKYSFHPSVIMWHVHCMQISILVKSFLSTCCKSDQAFLKYPRSAKCHPISRCSQ